MDRGPLRLECLENDKAVQSLRETTAKVALTLARVLDWSMKSHRTLLRSSSAQGRNNYTLMDIVQEDGEHLEHFHVYETAAKNETTKTANINTHCNFSEAKFYHEIIIRICMPSLEQ